MAKVRLTFEFTYDYDSRMWDVECLEAPGTHARHIEPYEALCDSGYSAFDRIESPDSVPVSDQKAYAQLNLDFVIAHPDDTQDEMIPRVYSEEQLRRVERFNLDVSPFA